MNKKKIALIVIFVMFLIFVIFIFIGEINDMKGNEITFRRNASKSFISVFTKQAQKDLYYKSGATIGSRGDRALFRFREIYNFAMVSFPIKPNFSINSDITQKEGVEDSDEPHIQGYSYTDGYKITYNGGAVKKAAKMFISYKGNITAPILQNDTTACFSYSLNQAYVQIQKKGLYEIFIAHEDEGLFEKKTPLIVLIKKRGDTLYFIIVTSSKQQNTLDPQTFFGLINGE